MRKKLDWTERVSLRMRPLALLAVATYLTVFLYKFC
jgi:hypothetical protein